MSPFKKFLLLITFLALPNIAWFSPRTSSGLTASQDVLANSSDTHNVGTQSNFWLNGFYRRVILRESSATPANVSSFGTFYVKSSDTLPYFVASNGSEYSLTAATPNNIKNIITKSASYSPLITESGATFRSFGNTASVSFLLPAITSLGTVYTFVNESDTQEIGVKAQSNQRIILRRNISGAEVGLPSSGDKVAAFSQDATITLMAASTDHWTVLDMEGDRWRNVGGN